MANVNPSIPALCRSIRSTHRLSAGREFLLDELAARQLRFRQVRVGDAFTVGDAEDHYFRARLTAYSARGALAYSLEPLLASPEPPIVLTLVCAVRAPERMGPLLEAATEMGVSAILPVFTRRSLSPKAVPPERIGGWPAQVMRCAKQCRRSSVPDLQPPAPLAEALRAPVVREAALRLYLDDRCEEAGIAPAYRESAVLVAGPDGGWTDDERELLWEAGVLSLALSGRLVRVEHGMVAALALLQVQPAGVLEVQGRVTDWESAAAGRPELPEGPTRTE